MNVFPEKTQLKIALLNAENLFLLFKQTPSLDLLKLDESAWLKLSSPIFQNKPLKKCFALAKLFKEIDADLVLLCEVGGNESLRNFNELFLGSAYSVALLEGNSDRNIDVGFLVRKELPFYFDIRTNKDRPIDFRYSHEKALGMKAPSYKFSRDVAELRLFCKDSEDPFFMVLLTHLKSRLDQEGLDPQGLGRRQAELNALVDLYLEIGRKRPRLPILVAGDFNGQAWRENTDEEFKRIYTDTDLEDVLQLDQIPSTLRATYYQIRNSAQAEGRQIDYCFLSQKLAPFLKMKSAAVLRYKDDMGVEIPPPKKMEEKYSLPSDHYPIVFELKDLKIW